MTRVAFIAKQVYDSDISAQASAVSLQTCHSLPLSCIDKSRGILNCIRSSVLVNYLSLCILFKATFFLMCVFDCVFHCYHLCLCMHMMQVWPKFQGIPCEIQMKTAGFLVGMLRFVSFLLLWCGVVLSRVYTLLCTLSICIIHYYN